MKKLLSLFAGIVLASPMATRAESLGDMVAAQGVEWIIAHWADKATGGQVIKLNYEWRLDKHAIAVKVKTPEAEAEGLIARNPKNGEVGYISVDNRGGGAMGKVSKDDDGRVVLKVTYQGSEDEPRRIAIIHEKKDDTTMTVIIRKLTESGELGDERQRIELVRQKD